MAMGWQWGGSGVGVELVIGGRFLGHFWVIFGSFLGHFWVIFGSFLGHIWVIFGSFPVRFRTDFGISYWPNQERNLTQVTVNFG